MKAQQRIFFDFLRFCIGATSEITESLREANWKVMYGFAKKQALIGVLFHGIQQLPKELAPDGDLLMTWMGMAQQIRRQNMKVNMLAGKLYAQLRKDGLRCCVLKGQGNAIMYPNPYSRNPGDIDVWVNAERSSLTEYAKEYFELGGDVRYHHLETSMDGVPVELHFMPRIMNNPIYNARLQKWFKRNVDLQCSNIVGLLDEAGEIAVPTTVFNVVYQLSHLYHHFFDEGIGMRQMIDYYFVINHLSSFESRQKILAKDNFSKTHPSSLTLKGGSTTFPKPLSPQGTGDVAGDAIALPEFWYRQRSLCPQGAADDCLTQQSCDCLSAGALQRELKYLGLFKFAGAVMYVLHEVLGLSEDKMIVPMDEKRGRLLLSEILNGGNFGKHFSKYGHFTQQDMAKKYFLKIWRNLHFVKYYPAEALSEPVFRTWHFLWRMWQK